MQAAVQVEGATKTVNGREILREVRLEVAAGTIHGLIGRSGAGKTTTLKSVLGFTRLSSGHIQVLGVPAERLFERHGQIGITLDRAAIESNLTVLQNLKLHALRFGRRGELAREWLDKLDLWDLRDQRAWRLSQGEQQRLGIALALFLQPSLLVMDEPLAHLDPGLARHVMELLRAEVKARGLTVLLSSHQLFHIERYADRMTLLHHGHVLLAGTMEELTRKRSPRLWLFAQPLERALQVLREVPALKDLVVEAGRLQRDGDDKVAGERWIRVDTREVDASTVNETLWKAGVRVSHLENERPSLDDLFYEATAQFDASMGHSP